jgi:3'(2'), 5'-bisphosphate nucleotidase
MPVDSSLLNGVVDLCRVAGEIIMTHYGRVVATEKADKSPLTEADLAANRSIVQALARLDPKTPVISEESELPPYEERKNWKRFWLVDPLDGTKEFLKKNGEFTVNVALIENGEPVLGVVGAPAKGVVYYAEKGRGAFKQADGKPAERIYSNTAKPGQPVVIVESRSHPSPEMDGFLKNLKIAGRVEAGSSLKFCLVADGTADLYPRFGPTMEWDVAAGDCLYRDSAREGRRKTTLTYNKPDLKNGGFVIGQEPK